MRLNLESRLAQRVLWRVASRVYRHEDDIYAVGRTVRWSDWITPRHTIRVDVTSRNSPLRSLNFAGLRIKDAVCDDLREATGERPERDVTDALKVLGYEADPATTIVREWGRFAGWLKFKGPKKIGQIIITEKLPVAASVSSPVSRAVAAMWGAFDVVNAIEGVLKTAAEWPRGNAEYEKSVQAHLDANASLKSYEAAFLASKQIADNFTSKGKTTARALGRALTAADVMFEMNNGAPVNSLILVSFFSKVCGTSVTGEVANVP